MKTDTSTTASVWTENNNSINLQAQLAGDPKTDVCIIGAGISGLTTAYQLLKAGKKVIILSNHKFGENETGYTSSHLSNALDDRYYNLIKMHGEKNAQLAAQSHMAAINYIERVVNENDIDCDFKRVDGILFADELTLKKEFDAATKCGVKVTFQEQKTLGKCLVFADQAQFQPLAYLASLAKIITAMGGEIYFSTNVAKIEEKPLQVKTDAGNTIFPDKIVTCTNSQFYSKFIMHFKLNPQRSYVIGVAIPKNSIKPALYWDNEDPYHYVRVYAKNDHEDLLIVGGEDHRVGLSTNPEVFSNLLKWSNKYFPTIHKKIEYQWSGQIIEPIDYLAYIGKNPKNSNIYMVTGDSGNGLTHGTIAGMLIADLIMQKTNPYEKVYQLQRLPMRSLGNFTSNMVASMKAFLAWLFPHFGRQPGKGEGKILQKGLKKIAVYKDENGKLHTCSAVCSHLGAILAWNPIEKTWDCSAHGSRFDVHGKVLNGPAFKCLKTE